MIVPLLLAVLAASLSSGLSPADLTSMNTEMTLLEQMVIDLRNEVKTTTTEIGAIKDELVAVKTELESTTSRLISVEGELNSLKAVCNSNPTHINVSVMDIISSDMKETIREMATLKSNLTVAVRDINDSKAHINDLEMDILTINISHSTNEESLRQRQEAMESRITAMDVMQMIAHEEVDHISTALNTTIKEVQEYQRTTESEINTLNTEMNFTSSKISQIQFVTESSIEELRTEMNKTNYKFVLHLKHSVKYEVVQTKTTSVQGGQTLKLDTVRVNAGNGYNSTTGRFTVPVAGSYLLWADLLFYDVSDASADMEMYVNGNAVMRGSSYNNHNSRYSSAVITYVTDLSAGDQVWYADLHGEAKYIFGDFYSSYGGMQLH